MPKAKPLTPQLINEFLTGHIPTRIAAITSYPDYSGIVEHKARLPHQVARRINCALGYSCVAMSRMLLEFLGITYGKGELIEKVQASYKPFDINVEELGGTFVRKKDLLPGEEESLRIFLHMANKVAHLTYDFRVEEGSGTDGNEEIGPTVKIILRLLDDHLYKRVGMAMVRDV